MICQTLKMEDRNTLEDYKLSSCKTAGLQGHQITKLQMTMANHDCPDITDESTVEDVVLHILRLRLGQHTFSDVAETFREEFVNGKVFVRLGKQDLNDLGIFQINRGKMIWVYRSANFTKKA